MDGLLQGQQNTRGGAEEEQGLLTVGVSELLGSPPVTGSFIPGVLIQLLNSTHPTVIHSLSQACLSRYSLGLCHLHLQLVSSDRFLPPVISSAARPSHSVSETHHSSRWHARHAW